ncbi:NADH-FMN oxidoreductase RutF, flavin reductase (DIM6/NTAB) family [Streptomyces sp. Termitarium-T10T-6]|nr:flavin reductase family protein [Streptomyces sp. Termitarium-T10T-6]SCD59257.1 NADH-FMN oxidoreductase RutF, flavin reductase (DIM6/NTAB) family [Streptomyces sp. Termitarium-T10T-6]
MTELSQLAGPNRPADPRRAAVAEGQRDMMSRFPTGVAILTAVDHTGSPRGMTISSLCSVSLEPPTLLVCLRSGSPTLEAVLDSGRFAVNLLHGTAQPAAALFASGAPDRFDRVHWEHDTDDPDAGGPHLFHDAHAIADCEVESRHRSGDHLVVIASVLRVSQFPGRAELVYGRREYRTWPVGESA